MGTFQGHNSTEKEKAEEKINQNEIKESTVKGHNTKLYQTLF